MKSIFLILFILNAILISFSNQAFSINKNKIELDNFEVDVVQKNLEIDDSFPINIKAALEDLFNNYIKVNGFEGHINLKFFNYVENISTIHNGKRVDTSFDFQITIKKLGLTNKEQFKGKVLNYSELSGDFSLNEFDQIIVDTQDKLVNIFIKEFEKFISSRKKA